MSGDDRASGLNALRTVPSCPERVSMLYVAASQRAHSVRHYRDDARPAGNGACPSVRLCPERVYEVLRWPIPHPPFLSLSDRNDAEPSGLNRALSLCHIRREGGEGFCRGRPPPQFFVPEATVTMRDPSGLNSALHYLMPGRGDLACRRPIPTDAVVACSRDDREPSRLNCASYSALSPERVGCLPVAASHTRRSFRLSRDDARAIRAECALFTFPFAREVARLYRWPHPHSRVVHRCGRRLSRPVLNCALRLPPFP